MKYCKKCGTLLEDGLYNCIRCGADVTDPENVSKYPVKVMETIEANAERKKDANKIAVLIIVLILILAVLVGLVFYSLGQKIADSRDAKEEQTEETAEDMQEAEPERVVSDENGKYYNYISECDEAGNVVFTAVVPEDMTLTEFYKDYEVYSTVYPMGLNFTAYNEDNSVRFTYLSPRHLWYKRSESRGSLNDAADIISYMTYYEYESPTSYLDMLIKQNYPGASIEVIDVYDINNVSISKIDNIGFSKNEEMNSLTDDYACIGMDTEYTNMDYTASAKIYEYEITTKDKDVVNCKYYIPAMANNLMFDNPENNDKGVITEWYNFGIFCYETGNDLLYEDYADDFEIFVANAQPTECFFVMMQEYAKEIKKDVEESQVPPKITKELLAEYASSYKAGEKLDDFNVMVEELLTSSLPKHFSFENSSIYTADDIQVVFCDPQGGKVFISTDETEYPGSEYNEYFSSEVSGES